MTRFVRFLVVAVLVFLAFVFYWTQVRPASIRKECYEDVLQDKSLKIKDANLIYGACLTKKGLKPEKVVLPE